jgi:ABC-type uncharacterized transport system auxiliary subunit
MSSHENSSRRFPIAVLIRTISTISAFFFLIPAGCIPSQRQANTITRFTLEYPSPQISAPALINQSIKVERFTVAKKFNTLSMVYRPEPFKIDEYSYNRWAVNPGDMVSESLLRDLKNSRLFSAVFSYRDIEDARFILEGSLDEFLEIDDRQTQFARIAVNVTLIDISRRAVQERIIFQKCFQVEEALSERSSSALAHAMSKGMSRISELIIRDAYGAISAVLDNHKSATSP